MWGGVGGRGEGVAGEEGGREWVGWGGRKWRQSGELRRQERSKGAARKAGRPREREGKRRKGETKAGGDFGNRAAGTIRRMGWESGGAGAGYGVRKRWQRAGWERSGKERLGVNGEDLRER